MITKTVLVTAFQTTLTTHGEYYPSTGNAQGREGACSQSTMTKSVPPLPASGSVPTSRLRPPTPSIIGRDVEV